MFVIFILVASPTRQIRRAAATRVSIGGGGFYVLQGEQHGAVKDMIAAKGEVGATRAFKHFFRIIQKWRRFGAPLNEKSA